MERIKSRHICPACGKKYTLRRSPGQVKMMPEHYELPCGEKCAERMGAIENWLRRRGIG